MSSIAASLTQRLEHFVARLEHRTITLATQREQLNKHVAAKLERIEASSEKRELESQEALLEKILAAAAANDFDSLTGREARAAARMVVALTPVQMTRLLTRRPEVWPRFVDEFFRSWDMLAHQPMRDGLVQLLLRTPDRRPFLRDVLTLPELLGLDGPRLFAQRTLQPSLSGVAEVLEKLGVRDRWNFTAHVLAHAAESYFQHHGFGRTWADLSATPKLAALLLPARQRESSPWFFRFAEAPRNSSVMAQARFVVLLLRELNKDASLHEALVPPLFDSQFGDPRNPTESNGWMFVRQADPETFGRFVEQLVREDLTLFFDHAMNEPDRRKFWLRYLPVIRRTVCVLGQASFEDLSRTLKASATPQVRGALTRARVFRANKGVSAFCLYFDQCVVVEFSSTGNAAYVYGRDVFESQVGPYLLANKLGSHEDLKLKQLNPERINHHKGTWQGAADDLLIRYGVRRR